MWLCDAGTAPWQWPSAPIEQLSDRPNYEVRQAVLADIGVQLTYLRTYNGEIVDLLEIS